MAGLPSTSSLTLRAHAASPTPSTAFRGRVCIPCPSTTLHQKVGRHAKIIDSSRMRNIRDVWGNLDLAPTLRPDPLSVLGISEPDKRRAGDAPGKGDGRWSTHTTRLYAGRKPWRAPGRPYSVSTVLPPGIP